MNAGDLVKFSIPTDDNEASDRFIVIELRGPRVLVKDANSTMSIVPTFVYLAADLTIA